jgi:uncharacterized membrane protein YsdA (DUF1294 family)
LNLLLAWVAVLSVLAFAACILDKAQAVRRRSRVPERVLLGLALLGGSPGLVVGMAAARHKTRKVSFLLRLGAILVVQASVLAAAWSQGLL